MSVIIIAIDENIKIFTYKLTFFTKKKEYNAHCILVKGTIELEHSETIKLLNVTNIMVP